MGDSSEEKVVQWQWMATEILADHLVPLLKHHDVKWRGHGIMEMEPSLIPALSFGGLDAISKYNLFS